MTSAHKLRTTEPKVSQLLTLLEASRHMGEKKDLDELLAYILNQTTIALECDRCTIFIVDRERNLVWSKIAQGAGEGIILKTGEGIAGTTIETGATIVIDDAYNDARFNPEIDRKTGYRTKTILCMPMATTNGVVVGCLQAINKEGGSFSAEDVALGLAFASQAAVSINSTLLLKQNLEMIQALSEAQTELRHKVNQIEAIAAIEKMVQDTDRLAEFFQHFSQSVLTTMNASSVSILIEWEQGKWLHFCRPSSKGELLETSLQAEQIAGITKRFKDEKVLSDQSAGYDLLDQHLAFSVKTRSVVPFPFTKLTQNGDKILRRGLLMIAFKGVHFFRGNRSPFLDIVSTNITAMIEKILERERQAQSNRLATIGQLSSTIFHDFRNPMASIRGIAEVIQLDLAHLSHEKIRRFAGIIQKQVDRCVGMIGELLEFARGETNFEFRDGHLKSFLDKISELLETDMERAGLKLSITVTKDCAFRFDEGRLMRVIFNLTNNAVEILKPGNTIAIEGGVNAQGFVEITVTDSGPGVPEHLQDTLFEVFVTHGKKNGTGLGLNIARAIVTGHGGEISLDKGFKKGARFVITLAKSPSAGG